MKCTNKKIIACLLSCITTITITGCNSVSMDNLIEDYNKSISQETLFADELVTPVDNVKLEGYVDDEEIVATALINLTSGEILQSTNLFEIISPASTTKILTAYVAIKKGNFDDIVQISETAVNLPAGSSLSGINAGDSVTLEDLLYALTLQSGNDSAIAIAEHISGSESAFVSEMNEMAKSLGATDTTFKNSHGLDADGHQTTVYDLYLMFNEIIKDPTFIEIISSLGYSTVIKDVEGVERNVEWIPTNYYHRGLVKSPENITIIGGKTGTTSKAKNCLVLLSEDKNSQYITITMGSSTKDGLYESLNQMLELIPIN